MGGGTGVVVIVGFQRESPWFLFFLIFFFFFGFFFFCFWVFFVRFCSGKGVVFVGRRIIKKKICII